MQSASAIWLVLVAPFIGSFLGVLALRLPQGCGVVIGRSRCDACEHVLVVSDLIPYISWLWLHGRCRYCKTPVGFFYPLMEFAALAVPLWAATVTAGPVLIASCVLGWTLLALAASDWRTYLLPDPLVVFLLIAGLSVTALLLPMQLAAHLLGAAAGYIAFAIIAWTYRKMRGSEGLGLGDAKLLAALGAWLSWDGLPSVVLLAAIMGLTGVLVSAAAQRRFDGFDRFERIPFGSFLAMGSWIVWLYGPLRFAS